MSNPLILLVDHSRFFLEIQKGFLKNTDARILCAASSREALESLRRQPADLVFLALELPGEDGVHCCRAIKADPSLQQIPVIMLHDADSPADRERCLKAGCEEVLTRPLDRKRFLEQGRKFLFKVERREPRIPFQTLVVYRHNGESTYGSSQDLSPGGIFINSSRRVNLGDRISLSLVLPDSADQVVEATGRVAWMNPGPITQSKDYPTGFGVEFLEFTPGCSSLLNRYLLQFSKSTATI